MNRGQGSAGLLVVALMVMGATGCGGKDTAAYPAKGSITGTLEAVGGPAGPARPLSGRITAHSGGHTWSTMAGTDGRFSFHVPPGTYGLTGRSPSYQDGTVDCIADGAVVVSSGSTVATHVMCQEK